MHSLRIFSIIAWIAIPTVMYGGYSLLGLLTRGGLSEFQKTFFRAGHAHAGVLLLMALLYHHYMEQTNLRPGLQVAATVVVMVGILALRRVFPAYGDWSTRCIIHGNHNHRLRCR